MNYELCLNPLSLPAESEKKAREYLDALFQGIAAISSRDKSGARFGNGVAAVRVPGVEESECYINRLGEIIMFFAVLSKQAKTTTSRKYGTPRALLKK